MILSFQFPAGSPLPSIRVLSKIYGVSTMSMQKGIAQAKEVGLVTQLPNRRLIASILPDTPYDTKQFFCLPNKGTTNSYANSPVLPYSSSKQRILQDIRKKILTGELNSKINFPSLKMFCQQYKASHRTIRAVLQELFAKATPFLQLGLL